jgi:uncharacterized protein YcnI
VRRTIGHQPRPAALGLSALALVLVMATPALAHVTVNPREVVEGSYTKLTVRVPNESETASTISVELTMPEGVTFQSVSVKPTPGWTNTVAKDGESVTAITWDGGKIKPGEFQEFDVSVGPVPEADSLEFRAIQTYDDGEVARWVEPTVEGEEEPEHPAPVVAVVEGTGDDHAEAGAATATSEKEDDGAEPMEFVSLIVAGVALVAALAALIMGRKRPPA